MGPTCSGKGISTMVLLAWAFMAWLRPHSGLREGGKAVLSPLKCPLTPWEGGQQAEPQPCLRGCLTSSCLPWWKGRSPHSGNMKGTGKVLWERDLWAGVGGGVGYFCERLEGGQEEEGVWGGAAICP